MNITVDKTNKTITLHEGVTVYDLVDYLHFNDIDGWSSYTIILPTPEKIIEYIPILQPPMPVNPFPWFPVYPSPTPYYPTYTITCHVKTNIT